MNINRVDSTNFNAVYVKNAKFSPRQLELKEDAFKKLTANCKDRIGINSTIAKAYSAQCNFVIEPAMDDGIAVRLESCGGNFTDDKVYFVNKDETFDAIPFLVKMKKNRVLRNGLIPFGSLLFSGALLFACGRFPSLEPFAQTLLSSAFGGMAIGGLGGVIGTSVVSSKTGKELEQKLRTEYTHSPIIERKSCVYSAQE